MASPSLDRSRVVSTVVLLVGMLTVPAAARAQDGAEAETVPVGVLVLESELSVEDPESGAALSWGATSGLHERVEMRAEAGVSASLDDQELALVADDASIAVKVLIARGPEGTDLAFAVELAAHLSDDAAGAGWTVTAIATHATELASTYLNLSYAHDSDGEQCAEGLAGVALLPDSPVGVAVEAAVTTDLSAAEYRALAALAVRPSEIAELRVAGVAMRDADDRATYEGRLGIALALE